MTNGKEIWWELQDESPDAVVSKIYTLGYSNVYCPYERLSRLTVDRMPRGVGLCVTVDGLGDLQALRADAALWERCRRVFVKDAALIEDVRNEIDRPIGFALRVVDRASLDRAVEMAQRVDCLVVELSDATNIPLELILATTDANGASVFKRVTSALDGRVSSMTMERGSDGIVLASDNLGEIMALDRALTESQVDTLALADGEVVRIEHAGMGNRACVDTTSELSQDEGLLLGSTSSGGVLTCSETHHLPYMNLRPFRVNAGALHLYVWGPDNRAVYLSDLRAGDKVLATDFKGAARQVTVGRVKTERRPLLLIECLVRGQRINTFIQDDWHVRVMGAGGAVRPSSEIRIGDKLVCYLDQPGRHVGIKIDETIKEA